MAALEAPLVLATRSAGKIRELRALCADAGLVVETLADLGLVESAAEDALEVHDTFEANARAKAGYFAALLPGRLVLAEDSGLVVDALGGAPGVRSKRWTGSQATGTALDDDNNAALLRALAGVLPAARTARYACAAVLQRDARTWSAEGRTEGRIVAAARGAGGFGYDPYFESAELGCTFGEASAEAKARVSHRGRAVRAVLARWSDDG
jgi:XTP/dITP diphosphohydrolase